MTEPFSDLVLARIGNQIEREMKFFDIHSMWFNWIQLLLLNPGERYLNGTNYRPRDCRVFGSMVLRYFALLYGQQTLVLLMLRA
ncbi:MAG: hypothetical protein DMG31_10075 [Acidobacteria bacterium]|nr:MAG: hypothetical protein DMG31_10075 [Acidobacteriota bacterium]